MNDTLMLTSSAFSDKGMIPSKFTCDGDRTLSPPLSITGVRAGAKSLVLIMDDPDIPQVVKESRGIAEFVHWVLYNIPAPETGTIDIAESASAHEHVGTAGCNSTGEVGYTGPCPPPEYEPHEHRYVFTLYALRDTLTFTEPPTKEKVLEAIAPLTIASTTLMGRYSRV